MSRGTEFARQFWGYGYYVIRGAHPPELISDVRDAVQPLLAQQQKPLDTIPLPVWEEPFKTLACHFITHQAFAAVGLWDLKYYGGAIINKRPREGRRHWHQDWWGWDDPVLSLRQRPLQVGCMHYLEPTSVENGCLRVLAGTHRRKFPQIHDNYKDDNYVLIDYPRWEEPLEVFPGDLVLIDARLLHSTYPNRTQFNRTGITTWWIPFFKDLPEHLQHHVSLALDSPMRAALGDLAPPEYTGPDGYHPDHKEPVMMENLP